MVTAGLIVNAYMEDLAENFMGRGRKEIFNSKVGHTVKVSRRQNFENWRGMGWETKILTFDIKQ